ncbi:MAG: mannose-1-phosphate guanylyltransferase [Acidobacteria bacterium]|nr:mannose-1-phosphate guanylyltransferase [Acidobacteriota bacterium]
MRNGSSPIDHLYGVILAGGRGTRFWPRSRRLHPKQLMHLWGPPGDTASLLQQTVARLRPVIPSQRIWIFTNEWLLKEVVRQLPEVPRQQVIAEPVQRNTGPCAGLAAELILRQDRDAILGLFPSDQLMTKPAAFLKVIRLAARHAAGGSMVVLGIAPRWAETGYGYMEFPSRPAHRNAKAVPIRQFREKPALAVARRYLRAGRFFWNSGMFFWQASTFQLELRKHLPKTARVLENIAQRAPTVNPVGFQRVLNALYPSCENISVDYAVLEKAQRVLGIPSEFGWSDVGSWNAVYDLSKRDSTGNVLRTEALLLDSTGLLIDVPGKLVAGIGLRDLVVVETKDALLIARREDTQQVSELVKRLHQAGRDDLL